MKTIIAIRILLIILLINPSIYAQHLIVVGHRQPALKIHAGFVVLNNSDILHGKITLCQHKKRYRGITIETDSQRTFIAEKDIIYLKLFDYDSTLVTTNYTEYRRVKEKPELWRHIGAGKIDIYDNFLYSTEDAGKIGEKILIVKNGCIQNISHTFSFFTTSDLFWYTNKKYNTNYKARDFKTEKDLLLYIVNKG